MKKKGLLMCAVLLAVALTACGGSTQGGTSVSTGAAGNESASSNAPNETAALQGGSGTAAGGSASADSAAAADQLADTADTAKTVGAQTDGASAAKTAVPSHVRRKLLPIKYQTDELLPAKEKQVINEEPGSYASFGINPAEMEAFQEEAAAQTSFPIISITTRDQEEILSKYTYVSCLVDVFNCPEEQVISEASAGIRLRGNSSSYYGDVEQIRTHSVPYRIKFDKKTNVLGLNEGARCKSWVLLKGGDSVIRNQLCLKMGRLILGDDAYCSDGQLVYVYVNGVFQDIYLLCEQNQVNEYRVDITEPANNYTGTDIGYYVEIENTPEEDDHCFNVDYGKHKATDIEGMEHKLTSTLFNVKSDVYTQGQIDFIDNYINNIFEIIYQACENKKFLTMDEDYQLVDADYKDAKSTIEAEVDLQSVVDMYILYELVHDYDCGEGSFYMCVDFAEDSDVPRLTFTSPWDFNWTFDGKPNRYWAGAFCEKGFEAEHGDRSNPWFIILIKEKWFQQMVSEKWTELQKAGIIKTCINEEVELLDTQKAEVNVVKSWATDAALDVIVWLKRRVEWMDTQFLLKD